MAQIDNTLQTSESILTPQFEPFAYGGVMIGKDGFVYLHRKILDWEWYDDHNVFRLFIYLLLKANWKDGKWKGHEVKRGQHITSIQTLVETTGLTAQQVRTALKKLKSTGEVTSKNIIKSSLLTIVKYNDYQNQNITDNTLINTVDNIVITSKQHRNNIEITTKNNNNNVNNENKEIINRETTKKFIKPSLQELTDYIQSLGAEIDPDHFFDYYESKGWIVGKTKMKDWKATVRNWQRRNTKSDDDYIPMVRGIV